jgi:UDP-4-amino-4-deoxy-L-arabinose formyltransferase/UDP-glucuronic acid dehydrogenase (UDP-4-keto-hexauronic acid decarboxylating)
MRIYLLNAIQSGLDLCEQLRRRIPIAGYIGLSDRWDSDRASGYVNARKHCVSNAIPYSEVDSYGLNKDADREFLLGLEIDVLVVAGWQRLIPPWLIDHVRQCCVGMHGSPLGITRGRGRTCPRGR